MFKSQGMHVNTELKRVATRSVSAVMRGVCAVRVSCLSLLVCVCVCVSVFAQMKAWQKSCF